MISRNIQVGMVLVVSLAVLGLSPSCTSNSASATTLYVSPQGPLRSIEAARDAVRDLKAHLKLSGPVHVVIESGVYAVSQKIVFTPEDSGTSAAPIIYEAAPGAHPVFTGGRIVSGFTPAGPDLWQANLPDVKAGQWYFEQLWVNGRRATRARAPGKFYFYATQRARASDDPTHTASDIPTNQRAFQARPQDVAALAALTPAELHDVTVVAFHSWETARLRVASVNPKTGSLFFTGGTQWGFFNFFPQQRYYIENFKDGLTQPGEWFLDRSGVLYYKPLPGETLANTTVVAPAGVDQFIQIEGDPVNNSYVEHVQFRGLSFRNSQYILPPQGHSTDQAEKDIPAVVMADGAREVTFNNCEIAHIGTYALWFKDGCSDCKIEHCYFHDLGAGGVRIGNMQDPVKPALTTGHITVDDNIIQGACRIHTGAIGVWIGQSADNTVTHNDIGDLYYTGISVGWTWGYKPSTAKRNTISFNHIHHIGQDVLGDMGAVYTLGPSEGTTVNNNSIHDVYSFANGASGLYNDEGSTGVTLSNNLVHDVDWGYHQNYGRQDTLTNNIFAFCREFGVSHPNATSPLSLTFERNILYSPGKLFFRGSFEGDVQLGSNVYWDPKNTPNAYAGKSAGDWFSGGRDSTSTAADPRFVSADARNFSLKPDSPALVRGFHPFDPSKAGVYGDSDWVALAAKLNSQMPVLEAPPAPPPVPPLDVSDGFEDQPVGTQPEDASVDLSGNGDSAAVTAEAASSGKQSLKIVSGAGPANDFHPLVTYTPHYTSGVANISFDIRITPSTGVDIEGRDWPDGKPYRTGPDLRIERGALMALGHNLMPLPTDRWIHIALVCGVGNRLPGTWNLTVAVPGDSPHVFSGITLSDPQFRELDWWALHNTAPGPSIYYIDNVEIHNTP